MENIIELKEKLKSLEDSCHKCRGNFGDDCRDCKQLDEKFALQDKIKKEKERINKALADLRKIPGGDIYDDIHANAKQHDEAVKKMQDKENARKQELQDKDNKIKELEAKLQDAENKYKYLLADLENIKKRYNKQLEDKSKYEGELILKNLLNIYDNIEMASKYNDEKSIVGKVNYEMLNKQVLDVLSNHGVELIYKEERPAYFNPEYDEAIFSQICNDKTLDNSIVNVYQKGFFFKDKILRFEKVIVNKYND